MKKRTFLSIVLFIFVAFFSFFLISCDEEDIELTSLQSEYGVIVEGASFENGTILTSKEISSLTQEGLDILSKISDKSYNKEGSVYIFDIYLSKNGNKIQPSGEVSVSIPIPSIEIEKYSLFHIMDDNKIEELTPSYANGILKFFVSSFSYFIIAEKNLDHTHTYVWNEGTSASCSAEGVAPHYHCDGCNKSFDSDYKELDSTILPILNHDYGSMYWGKSPSFWEDGNIEYYICGECGKYFDSDYKEVESVVLPKLLTNISICVNGVATPLEMVEKTDSHIIWTLDNLDVTKGDIITICVTDNQAVTYNYFAEGNVNKDNKIQTTAENTSVQATATPNGIMLFIGGYKYEGIVVEINGEQYPMASVNYQDGTPTNIYGYVSLNKGDKLVIIDNINDITYDYDDLDESRLWNKWDFHRGDYGEFVIDYSARYGIEFNDGGNKKIYLDKIFAPADGNSFEIVFEDETMDSAPLTGINISSNDEAYAEILWELNHNEVMNKEDIVSYLDEHGIYVYTDTIYLEAGVKFNLRNVTKDSVIGFDKLTDVYTSSDNFTKDGDYIKILNSGYYMISYVPCCDSFMFRNPFVEETADLFMYLDGEFIPLTINDDNTVTYEDLVVEQYTNITFVSNDYLEYYPITIDSSTDSSIANIIESSGMSIVFFNKAGTYDLAYNTETGILSIIDQNPEEPDDTSVEYMYFLSVVDSANGNQTLYFTRIVDENKEVVVKDANLGANCYIAVGGISLDGSGDSVTYGALSNTDSNIAMSYGTLILVKQAGKFDVYFNTETKSARLVLAE